MASREYVATMMDTVAGVGHGGEQNYTFQGPDDLFDNSPIKIIKAFMEHVDHVELPAEHMGYELYSTLKNDQQQVVTGLGSLLLDRGVIPFMVMISPKP